MDKKTIIGFVLIGVILFGYSYFFAPEPEQNPTSENKKEKSDSSTAVATSDTVQLDSLNTSATLAEVSDSAAQNDSVLVGQVATESSVFTQARVDFIKSDESVLSLENELLKINFTNQGGAIADVFLKKYQDYEAFKEQGFSKDTIFKPLRLLEKETNAISFALPGLGAGLTSKDLAFSSAKSDSSVTFKVAEKGKEFAITYTLRANRYDLDMSIDNKGFSQAELDAINLNWHALIPVTEKSPKQQKMLSGIFYQNDEGDFDYLAEATEGDETVDENEVEWVAFKHGHFSSILKAPKKFKKNAHLFGDNTDDRDSSYVSEFHAKLTPNLAAGSSTSFSWYFGPNDYEILKTYEDGTEDVINWGLGVFRWINKYAINPVFRWFNKSLGMSLAIAILFLTIVVKIVLMPVNYKMYTQSAKMRVIKPELEEFNKKWEGKNDPMGKQQEQMKLMKQLGVNQFAGCLPSLAQMPILIAVFRYFPSLVSLRQEGFLWAEDLSSYDAIVSWTGDLGVITSWYGNHVSLFTILMAIVVLINTFLTSGQMQQPQQEGMPNMKVIMYIMPFTMLIFFNQYASGLSYYYFISTLLSIVIMYFIKIFLIDEKKIRARIEENKADPNRAKKQSGFQARLAEMQRIQQEQAKKKRGN